MLLSRVCRVLPLARTLLNHGMKQSATKTVVPRRNHGSYGYRQPGPENPPIINTLAEAGGALMWWWIMWHIFTEYDHITGEYPYPDASKWTNEELGVPPDNYDPPARQ